MRRHDRGQKGSQVQGDLSGTESWRVVHDVTTIWQRVRVEELVKRRLRGTGECNDLDWGSRQAGRVGWQRGKPGVDYDTIIMWNTSNR